VPFSSITFIFLFLPITLLLFYILPYRGWRNSILVASSLFFFGWSDPTSIHVLLLSIIINYSWGLIIDKANGGLSEGKAKQQLWIGVGLNLLLLGFYKYTGFFLEFFETLLPIAIPFTEPGLPLGISFFTFSGISYLVDIYNEANPPEKNLIKFSSYLIMFPKLLQGPIARLIDIKDEIYDHKFLPLEMMQGIRRFIGGLAKKVILADSLAVATSLIFRAEFSLMGAGVAWFGLLAYTLQIYLDFSGYTDMAIGLGQMLGFKLPENFNFPYISRSISDFWRRWHMTLGAWLRTYLFIPLEFARKRVKHFRVQSNLIIVFFLIGLWHGADWNFIIWGIFYGVILAIEASGFGKTLKRLNPFIQHSYALILIMIGWIFFRITDIQQWGAFFSALLGFNGWRNAVTFRSLNILFYIPFLIPSILFSLPYMNNLAEKIKTRNKTALFILDAIFILLFLFTITFILSKGFTPFMYVEF
jgi:alginate O-acetyltransferase complex protein AlgI